MRHTDFIVQNLAEFIDALKQCSSADHLVWFRGQSVKEWKLIPSLGRDAAHLLRELAIIKRFKQNSRPYLSSPPMNEWEWIFLMQHHRAPTRLLDWTESPLAGLFFALYDPEARHQSSDAAVWCLDPVELNKAAGHRKIFDKELLAFGIDESLEQYLPDQVNTRKAVLDPIAGIGPRNSARMVAQAGAFTVMHAEVKAIEDVGNANHIWRIVIPAAARSTLLSELELLNIGEAMFFPDLDRVAAVARALLS